MRRRIPINDAQRRVLLIGLTLGAIFIGIMIGHAALGALLMVILWTTGAAALYADWQPRDRWHTD